MDRSGRYRFLPDIKEQLRKRTHLENGFARSTLKEIREYIFTMAD
jgi:hypothetical protein